MSADTGQPVQSVTTDWSGKYALAYHKPGRYLLQVGKLSIPVAIVDRD